MLPAGFALAGIIVFTGRMADRYPPRLMLVVGFVLMAASFVAMTLLGYRTAVIWLVAATVLSRIGLGFVLPSLNIGAMRGLDRELLAYGSSTISFIRMLGGATGVSLCGVFLQWRLTVHGTALGLATAQDIASRMRAFHESFVMLAVLCVLSMVAAWYMRPARGAVGAS
jgi:MFS family permease